MAKLNPALRDFWRRRARIRVLYGGRSSSKSWDAAGMVTYMASKARIRVLCTRQFQNKIEESVYTLLKIQIERLGLQDKFEILNNKITCLETGSEFLFYGLWRSIDEVKSLEGIDILWIEEAHNLTEEQWKILEPTIRKEGSQIWIIFNPRLATDFVYKRFVRNPPPDAVVRKINYDENPFLSETMRKVIEAAKAEDEEEYRHVYLGEPKDDDDMAVFKRSHLMTAIDAHKTLGIEIAGARSLGFDVADAGDDSCAMVESHGPLTSWARLWKAKEDELLKSCALVWKTARDRDDDIIYDAIGVGASAGAKFNELNAEHGKRIAHSKFLAGGAVFKPDQLYPGTKVKNRDYFANIKAQAWWMTADRVRNTFAAVKDGRTFDPSDLLFLDSSMPYLDEMIEELCIPKRDFDSAGRVKVESKKDLAKRDIASPNLADAFIMAHAGPMLRARSFFG
ncbi:PBSX family phage terminase large subunit [Curvibacter lanceolatus]|uniref:PBSX family phage terminase large subunit n=1 Tax=Curvibacter lanceolatus TaxID=86182 RepID=UPI00036AD582|nr:PBSX family phage terminase large subunit [Curvibacter lanceolatus]